jgi:hypothetical protein
MEDLTEAQLNRVILLMDKTDLQELMLRGLQLMEVAEVVDLEPHKLPLQIQ